ncbi:MAG: GNAT family N-acetyltransferase [Promethearchaeota archaeon]
MFELFQLKNGRKVSIKRLFKDDYEKNNNYTFVYNWLHDVNKYLSLNFEKKDLKQNKITYYKMISNEKLYIVIGAIFNEAIIATAHLSLVPPETKSGHVGTWGIAVHPDFQYQGLGRKLLEQVEECARQKGLKKLQASFFAKNERAEKLYIEKMNYVIEGKQKFAALLNDGTYTDIVLIGKILDKELAQ